MSKISVDFQHWRHTFPEDLLIRYGSPHFSRNEAGHNLMKAVIPKCTLEHSFTTQLDRRQAFVANEAFPEAAVADPLADLDVWDEWLTGARVFPYPGQYTPLGITNQEGKTSSPSSVGVLGEIATGLFAQSYVAPQVLVRVIRHWPDFIFYSGDHRFSFVESKAFTDVERASDKLYHKLGIRVDATTCRPERLSRTEFPDLLVDAIHQLNADPFVKVWGAFTGVKQITPQLQLHVTFFELDVPEARRKAQAKRILPHAVVRGIAQRAISQGARHLSESELAIFHKKRPRGKKSKGSLPVGRGERNLPHLDVREVEVKLTDAAFDELPSVLGPAAEDAAALASMESLRQEIVSISHSFVLSGRPEGKRFFETKGSNAAGLLRFVRQVGNEQLFTANMPESTLAELERHWDGDWQSAATPWRVIDDVPVWRCGGSVYCLGASTLEGQSID